MSTDLNTNLNLKHSFTGTSRLVFHQTTGNLGLAKWRHKIHRHTLPPSTLLNQLLHFNKLPGRMEVHEGLGGTAFEFIPDISESFLWISGTPFPGPCHLCHAWNLEPTLCKEAVRC